MFVETQGRVEWREAPSGRGSFPGSDNAELDAPISGRRSPTVRVAPLDGVNHSACQCRRRPCRRARKRGLENASGYGPACQIESDALAPDAKRMKPWVESGNRVAGGRQIYAGISMTKAEEKEKGEEKGV